VVGELLGQRRQGVRARVDAVLETCGNKVELARGAVPSAVQLATKDEAGAEPGADGEEHEILDTTSNPEPLLP